MSKRHKMGNQQSKRDFSRKAVNHHPKNMTAGPMRGGIRL